MKKVSLIALLIGLLVGCGEKALQQTTAETDLALTATGELISTNSATVSPPTVSRMWQYKIQFMAKENSKVKKGDVVVRFDPQELRENLMSKQSELAAAIKDKEQKQLQQEQRGQKLTLELAEAKMNYEKEKRKAEIVDAARSGIERQKQQKSFEIAELKYQQVGQKKANFEQSKEVNGVVTEAKITRLKTIVSKLKADIEKLNVKAPKSGIVMYITDHKGEKLAVGDTVWQGQRVLTIPSLDEIAIQAQFDEPDTANVAINQNVKVTLEPYPEEPFVGQITSLGQSYKNKSQQNPKVVFDVFISLSEIDKSLMRPGMKAKIELIQNDEAVKKESHG